MDTEKNNGGINGLAGEHCDDKNKNEYFYSGGGYFEGASGIDINGKDRNKVCLGGFFSVSENKNIIGSTGGIAGSGGNIVLNGNSKLEAFNGNKITNNSKKEYVEIFSQNGKTIDKYDYKKVDGIDFKLYKVNKSKKVKTTDFGQGIGTGAGYIEGNNGTFKDNTK